MEPNYGQADLVVTALDWNIARAHGPGTVSNRSIAEGFYRNTHGLFFLAKDGVYFTNGMESIKVSGDIDTLFKKKYGSADRFYSDSFDEQYWGNAAGVWFRGRYYLAYYARGDSDNEATVILNTETGKWERDVNASPVYPRMYTVGEGSTGIPELYCGCDNGDVYKLREERYQISDGATAFQSDFRTLFIGTELLEEIDWQTLNLWVYPHSTATSSIVVKVFTVRDYDSTSSYDTWREEMTEGEDELLTVTTAFAVGTGNNNKWHRLRIPLNDVTNDVYPRARAISLKIYDDNDRPLDYRPESLVCEPLLDELR